MKVLRINGIKGLITALFIGICLFQGFVVFPGLFAMNLWNKYLVNLLNFPTLNLFQGVLLWGIVVISYFIMSKSGLEVSFTEPDFSEEELKKIVQSARINAQIMKMNGSVCKKDKFELPSGLTSDKDTPYLSSPVSINKQEPSENCEDEKVSKIK